jgi:hypothetical protein
VFKFSICCFDLNFSILPVGSWRGFLWLSFISLWETRYQISEFLDFLLVGFILAEVLAIDSIFPDSLREIKCTDFTFYALDIIKSLIFYQVLSANWACNCPDSFMIESNFIRLWLNPVPDRLAINYILWFSICTMVIGFWILLLGFNLSQENFIIITIVILKKEIDFTSLIKKEANWDCNHNVCLEFDLPTLNIINLSYVHISFKLIVLWGKFDTKKLQIFSLILVLRLVWN